MVDLSESHAHVLATIRTVVVRPPGLAWAELAVNSCDGHILDSTRLDSTRLDLTRLDLTRLDSTRLTLAVKGVTVPRKRATAAWRTEKGRVSESCLRI